MAARNGTRQILLVDDEAAMRTMWRLALSWLGYDVVEAENGFEALRLVRKQRPDLVLLDVMMPGMDGFAVCAELRRHEDTAELPVIMMTPREDAESLARGRAAGATKYVTKPVAPEELARQVRETLSSCEG